MSSDERGERPFSWGRTFLIGFGFLGISLVWALYNSYVPILLKDSFALTSLWIGAVMTVNNGVTTALLPVFGSMSDRTWTRLGRRGPYIAAGTPIAAALFAAIPAAAGSGSLGLMLGTLLGVNVAMAIYRAPTVALMPDITPSRARGQANGVINLMGGLGALIAFFGGKALYDRGAQLPFLAAAGLSVVSSALVLLVVREPKPVAGPSRGGDAASSGSRGALLEHLRGAFGRGGDRSLLALLLAVFLWSVGFSAVSTFLTSYTRFHLGLPASTGAVILGVFALSFIVAAIGAGYVGAAVGRSRAVLAGLAALGVVLLSVLSVRALLPVGTLFAFGGVAWALVVVNALPMVIELAPEDQAGASTGLYYFASQLGTILAPAAAGGLIDGFGYPALMVFCSLTFLAAGACMSRVRGGEGELPGGVAHAAR